ncbi:MAG: ATP-binding cassette domain-containing protein [Pseudohongiella sp.]|nr:ATP-binding cassette domain-containing protein [Pseudohongiella sp.]
MSALAFSNLAVEFNHSVLFSNLSASLSAGITALAGVNGIGKSVLLKVLSGDILATQGQVQRPARLYRVDQLQMVTGPRIADALGVAELFECFQRIGQGCARGDDPDKVADHWHEPALWRSILEQAGLYKPLDTRTESLSGGERVRLALCAAFIRKDAFLLLDEPGNHLDIDGKQWLKQCLQAHAGGVLMVSHDPELLSLATQILELNQHGLTVHGSYPVWQMWQQLQEQALARRIHGLEKQTRQLVREHQDNLRKSTRRRQQGEKLRREGSQGKLLLDAKADQAQRSLAREQVRHKQQEESLQSSRQQLSVQRELLTIQRLPFPPVQRGQQVVFTLCGVELPFSKAGRRVNWTVRQGERWRLSGRNGSGKSSLLKLLAGLLPLRNGECRRCSGAVYLDQHLSMLDPAASAVSNLMRLVPGRSETDWRTWLGSLRLAADKALLPVAALSGGERLKVAVLALAGGEEAPELLLLDEPDNHLDADSRQLLANSLATYQGALVLVSHQQSFVDAVTVHHEFSL